MERQLPVHFELIGRRHPSTRVQNDVVELSPARQEERERERERDKENEQSFKPNESESVFCLND